MAQLNRRRFLEGLGGAVLAAPFLSSVAPRLARGQAVVPKRLIAFFSHYGCLTNRWFPAKSHGELTAADYKGTTLEPLAPYASKLLMPRGIRAMNEWSFDQRYGQETDPHDQVMATYFTGCPVDLWSGLDRPANLSESALPVRAFPAMPAGRSLDHLCAEQVNDGNKPLALTLGSRGRTAGLSYTHGDDGDIQAFPGNNNPASLFNTFTDRFAAGTTTETTYRMARGQSALDLFRDDLARLQAANMSRADKHKLEAWAELLHETSTTLAGQCSTEAAATLELTSESTGTNTTDIQTTAPLMLNLAVLSALCDTNRIIFLEFPGSHDFSFLPGVEGESHGLSHRVGSANMGGPCVTGVNEMIASVDSWHAKQFAHLVGQLDNVPEGEGTLLDNTATVWFQEMSDGSSHNLNNLPILQAGGCGGYFKLGLAVNVDHGDAELSRGNSESACGPGQTELAINDIESTGTPADIASMPINKYFCNLMNALGVKAGDDGFAAKGGSAEVSRFGMYDDTTLFATYLSTDPAPPAISNPGEYTELRADS